MIIGYLIDGKESKEIHLDPIFYDQDHGLLYSNTWNFKVDVWKEQIENLMSDDQKIVAKAFQEATAISGLYFSTTRRNENG